MMQMNGLKVAMVLVLACTVTACAPKRTLTPSAITGGADEFAIVPTRTLESPDDFSTLPAPTPGGSNATDVSPKADAIAALGGRLPTVASAADGNVLSYASRYGVDANIRAELSEADEKFLKRKTNTPSWPWVSNKYERAYTRFGLDATAELERLRSLGISVPSMPSGK
jgi:hypothetical protein